MHSPLLDASLNATLLSPRLVMTSNTTTTTVTTTVTTPIISTESVYNASPVPFRTFQQRVNNRLDSMNGGCRSYYNSTSFPGPSGGNEVPPVNSFNLRPIPDHPMRQPSSFNYNVHYDPAPASSHFIFNENPAPVGNQQRYSDSAPARSFNNHPVQPCERELRSNDGIPPAQCYSPPPPSPPNPIADIQVSSGASNLQAPPAIPGTSKQHPFQSNTITVKNSIHADNEVLFDSPMRLIHIPVSLDGSRLDTIVDSGASGNFIRSTRVDLTSVEPVEFEASLATDKGSLSITGKISLDIAINGHSYRLIFYTCPNLSHEAILGQPFLHQVNAILDFTRRCITLGTSSRNIVYWQEPKQPDFDIHIPSGIVDHIAEPARSDLLNVILRHKPVFNDKTLGHTGLTVHKIQLTDPRPFKQYPYKYSPQKREIIKTIVRELESLDVIERSTSPYNSPIVVTEYPPDSGKDPRLCIDFRRLNEITVEEPCLKTNIHTLIHEVQGASIFTTLDLKKGYYQVEMDPSSRPYTAFTTPDGGTYQFKRLPFGLRNAPACFQRLMTQQVLDGLIGDICIIYLDDILIFSRTWSDHVTHIALVLERLQHSGLTVSLKKCQFGRSSLEYLGHVIKEEGNFPMEKHFRAIRDRDPPKTKKQLQSFLGTCNWLRDFVPHAATVLAPLCEHLKHSKWTWTDEDTSHFNRAKEAFSNIQMLSRPDFSGPKFYLQTDAKLSFSIEHCPGRENELADALSRYPDSPKDVNTEDWERMELPRTTVPPPSRLEVNSLGAFSLADALREGQASDPSCQQLIQELRDNPANANYSIQKDLLMHRQAEDSDWKIVVPSSKITSVLFHFHDDPLASHPGESVTYDLIQRRHFWKTLRSDVKHRPLTSHLINLWTSAKRNMHSYSKRYSARKYHRPALRPGTQVWLRNRILSNKVAGVCSSLLPRWKGPFRILRNIGNVYWLDQPGTGRPIKAHRDDLQRKREWAILRDAALLSAQASAPTQTSAPTPALNPAPAQTQATTPATTAEPTPALNPTPVLTQAPAPATIAEPPHPIPEVPVETPARRFAPARSPSPDPLVLFPDPPKRTSPPTAVERAVTSRCHERHHVSARCRVPIVPPDLTYECLLGIECHSRPPAIRPIPPTFSLPSQRAAPPSASAPKFKSLREYVREMSARDPPRPGGRPLKEGSECRPGVPEKREPSTLALGDPAGPERTQKEKDSRLVSD
ncbi:hypothetical protein M8J76_012233 [Diaphorina citri]|nr:hypothetical protein M8J76_012233 [Diaphorina citri]